MPTTELELLRAEIANLKAEKRQLEATKEAKLKAAGLKLTNIPRKIQAAHPILSKAAQYAGQGTVAAGKGLWKGLNWMAKQQEKAEKVQARRRLAEA
jgi:hypothetical protein